MRVRFTIEALTHIAGIHLFIAGHSRVAATHIVTRIFAAADRLSEFPHIGHVGAVPGTYEWTVQGLPYIIVHEVDDDKDELIVLGIFHGAQDR
jgi:toxin ParE1/3/4